jgi:hypothetical protein
VGYLTDLTDGVLGESRSETVPTATVIAFTGNNISPKGDMASRSLVAHLATDRTDPENRDFAHEDPLAWTKANRVEILRCLYMLLMLDRAKPNKAKTRFKPWWLLIGHPVELVAGGTSRRPSKLTTSTTRRRRGQPSLWR